MSRVNRSVQFYVFLRHGIAEDGRAGQSDGERELTAEGHEQMQQIARGLARVFPEVDAIYSSPLVRAAQTAEWVAKAYGALPVTIAAALSTDASTQELLAFLQSIDAHRAIFVGHEPSLSGVLAEVIRSDAPVPLQRGGCYAVRVHHGGGATLEWLATTTLLLSAGQ
jgi:phosphohistidine phosphatase SixA